MPKKAGIVLVMTGAVLMISALLLFMYNRRESQMAGEHASGALDELHAMLSQEDLLNSDVNSSPDETEAESDGLEETTQEPETTEEVLLDASGMRIVMIDGYEYIGYLTISSIDLQLPILAQWDAVRLKIAPCRQEGSLYQDDLVIAGHNYDTFFAKLGSVESGDPILFTDMYGIDHEYEAIWVKTVLPTAVEEVLNSGYDLVIYTCTPTAEERIVVFCERVYEELVPEEDPQTTLAGGSGYE